MAKYTLTATELKLAVVDPAWRASWLAGKKPHTRTFPPAGTLPALALQFHSEAERLVRWLTARDSLVAAAAIDSPEVLVEHLWRSSLQGYTDRLFADGRGDEANLFTERVRNFCRRLIDIRRAAVGFENWQDVFIAAELDLGGVSVPVGKCSVQIGARVDAVRFRPDRRLEVVDYKLSQGQQQKADLVQLAIYAELLSRWRPGCEFCGTLEYYLPALSETQVSRADLADIFTAMVAPVLEEMFGSRPVVIPPAIGKGKAGPAPDSGDLRSRTVAAFRSFGLEVDVARVIEGPQLVRLHLIPAAGVKVASLANRAEDLQVALSLAEPPLIKAGRGFVGLDVPRQQPEPCLLQDALAGAFASKLTGPVAFPVGVGIDGEPVVADFADPGTCHLLVAGAAGSGKSEWLKSLVASVAIRSLHERVQIALVDPKILTFAGVERSPYLWRPVATTLSDALAILHDAAAEMGTRYQRMQSEGFVNLAERFRAGKTDIPFLVLIFDEFANLILSGGDDKKEFEALVARIAAMGRAAGVHLVLATQRPDRQIVAGLTKANLPMQVCLRVANATNSQIVLGEPGAESLYGKGDLLCDFGKGLVRAQGLYIPQAEFLRVMAGAPRDVRRAG